MSFLASTVSPSSTPHQETEGVTHSCLSQVTVSWAKQDGKWKLYYNANITKCTHTDRKFSNCTLIRIILKGIFGSPKPQIKYITT